MKVQAIILPYYGIGDFLTHLPFVNALLKQFPKNQFILDGYNQFRFNNTSTSGGLIIFIREDNPCKLLTITEWPSEL